MATYLFNGRWKFSAETNQQIVEQLNVGSLFGYRDSNFDFMSDSARACKLYNGSVIRACSVDDFVEDLILNQFLIKEE